MIEIGINNVNKSFGENEILKNINFTVSTGEIVSFVGSNGSGKSTLLKIIAKEEPIDAGSLSIRNSATIGYLKQELPTYEGKIVEDILYESKTEILEMEKKLRKYERKMQKAMNEELEPLLKKYGDLQEKYFSSNSYKIAIHIEKVIQDFKLKKLLKTPFCCLSGGEKRMVSLAALMILNPDILLLDEPTNHLDIDTLEWLESYLKEQKKTMILVSHDRYFLDHIATKTILFENKTAHIFNGNYTYALENFEKQKSKEQEEYKNQQKQIQSMQTTIKKLREWGKIGDNELFFRRAKNIEKRLEKMDKKEKPQQIQDIPVSFEVKTRSGKDVLRIEGLDIDIKDRSLLKKVYLNIKYQEKVCLIGKNGTGKSTLIQTILECIKKENPRIRIGSKVSIGYIPQNIQFSNTKETLFSFTKSFYNGEENHLRSALAKFHFPKNTIFKKIEQLSGGEKVRLKLFELIEKKANFLILDEVTNHIDIKTKEILEEALLQFQGTILFISHDRYFINKIATKILSIEKETIKEYLGNYEDYKQNTKN